MGAPRGNKNAAGKHKKLTSKMLQNYNYANAMRNNFNHMARKSGKTPFGEKTSYADRTFNMAKAWSAKMKRIQKVTGHSHRSIKKLLNK